MPGNDKGLAEAKPLNRLCSCRPVARWLMGEHLGVTNAAQDKPTERALVTMMQNRLVVPSSLASPHIPLGMDLLAALDLLLQFGPVTGRDGDICNEYELSCPGFTMAIEHQHERVSAVRINDPTGRWSLPGKQRKIDLYMARYGPPSDWVLRINSRRLHYWSNRTTRVGMWYGIQGDFFRFCPCYQLARAGEPDSNTPQVVDQHGIAQLVSEALGRRRR